TYDEPRSVSALTPFAGYDDVLVLRAVPLPRDAALLDAVVVLETAVLPTAALLPDAAGPAVTSGALDVVARFAGWDAVADEHPAQISATVTTAAATLVLVCALAIKEHPHQCRRAVARRRVVNSAAAPRRSRSPASATIGVISGVPVKASFPP